MPSNSPAACRSLRPAGVLETDELCEDFPLWEVVEAALVATAAL